MPRKGRARRFREARALKQGFEDGLFQEGSGTLADVSDEASEAGEDDDLKADEWDEEDDDEDDGYDWDPDRNL
ncbi:MAG: hypothetical protein JWL83_4742 [Actinomycetia bacterium]|nr:hypothetical protein [Actinomycetes bacterium]